MNRDAVVAGKGPLELDRYTAVVFDEPMIWMLQFRNLESANDAVSDLVRQREQLNGAGVGYVICNRSGSTLFEFGTRPESCEIYGEGRGNGRGSAPSVSTYDEIVAWALHMS